LGARTSAAAKRIEAGHGRVAIGIDFAAIERFAFFVVANNVIGRGDLGKALFGLGVIGVLIGMIFLGELAVRGLDRRAVRAFGHTKNGIRVTHESPNSDIPVAEGETKSAGM
jgi:hypothetical protein